MWGETLGGHFSFPGTKDSTLDQGPGSGTGEKPIDLKTGGPSAVQMEAEVSDHLAPGGWKKHSRPGVSCLTSCSSSLLERQLIHSLFLGSLFSHKSPFLLKKKKEHDLNKGGNKWID